MIAQGEWQVSVSCTVNNAGWLQTTKQLRTFQIYVFDIRSKYAMPSSEIDGNVFETATGRCFRFIGARLAHKTLGKVLHKG